MQRFGKEEDALHFRTGKRTTQIFLRDLKKLTSRLTAVKFLYLLCGENRLCKGTWRDGHVCDLRLKRIYGRRGQYHGACGKLLFRRGILFFQGGKVGKMDPDKILRLIKIERKDSLLFPIAQGSHHVLLRVVKFIRNVRNAGGLTGIQHADQI